MSPDMSISSTGSWGRSFHTATDTMVVYACCSTMTFERATDDGLRRRCDLCGWWLTPRWGGGGFNLNAQAGGRADTWSYARRRIRGALNIGFGCQRCHMSHDLVMFHSTSYSASSGCLPLCEPCWSELTPTQRVPYYRALYEIWIRDQKKWLENHDEDYDLEPWGNIVAAVLAGR